MIKEFREERLMRSRLSRFHDANDRSIDLMLALDRNVGVCLILFLFLIVANGKSTFIHSFFHSLSTRGKKEREEKGSKPFLRFGFG